MKQLKEELLKGLKILSESDRDLRTLTIWCNSNFSKGSDKNIKISIKKILDELIESKKIFTSKININKKRYEVYNLK